MDQDSIHRGYVTVSSTPVRILIVEDDEESRELLTDYLARNGCDVQAVPDGGAMWRALEGNHFDILIMDIMLPGDDGLTLCRNLRAEKGRPYLPVIMLTARGDDMDRIIGLEIGADDYLAKPYNPRELLARIKSVLRRVQAVPCGPGAREKSLESLRFSGWTLALKSQQLISDAGEVVPLTRGEFNLLLIFLRHPGEILDRDRIMEDYANREATAFDRSIDVQIGRLRKRLGEDPKSPRIIRTVWGKGYMLTVTVEEAYSA
ncbi:MAG: response regulator [Magnetococcus sp. WYHC-3]